MEIGVGCFQEREEVALTVYELRTYTFQVGKMAEAVCPRARRYRDGPGGGAGGGPGGGGGAGAGADLGDTDSQAPAATGTRWPLAYMHCM
jgi:hypothetical protein